MGAFSDHGVTTNPKPRRDSTTVEALGLVTLRVTRKCTVKAMAF